MAPTPDRTELRAQLGNGLHQLSVTINEQATEQLVDYVLLLEKWNRVYNLTAVRDTSQMIGRHLLDSLSILPWVTVSDASNETTVSNPATDSTVLDVGSGAGLPVLPLAIVRPDVPFLSVESNGKKTRFQQQALQELGIGNVQVKQSRIEAVQTKASVIVSRAFTAPEQFLTAVEKNCVSGSIVIVMLGQKERMPSKLPVGFNLNELCELNVPYCEFPRHVAIVEKV